MSAHLEPTAAFATASRALSLLFLCRHTFRRFLSFLTSHRLTNQKMPWGQCARARMDSENGMLGQQRRAADEKEAE